MMRRHLPLVFVLLATGCAVGPPRPQDAPLKVETPKEGAERRARASRPTYNLAGYPPALRDGYIDGCESAKGSEFARKDPKRMSGEAQYAQGWNDGFSICGIKR